MKKPLRKYGNGMEAHIRTLERDFLDAIREAKITTHKDGGFVLSFWYARQHYRLHLPPLSEN